MKNLLLFILFSISICASAQQLPKQKTVSPYVKTPGSLLVKGSDHMLSGILLTFAGAGLMAIGANGHDPLLYVGAGMTTVGFGFSISGIKKIGFAGAMMK